MLNQTQTGRQQQMMLGPQAQFHYLFKVVLVGNSAVGKSSLVIRYADDEFSDVFLATIGVDFRFKSFPLQGNKVKLQIWDTAGHQRFRTITSSYYRGAHALMIVFDITDLQSFQDAINYWLAEVRGSCPPETQILLIGNKSDMDEERKVTKQQLDRVLDTNPQIKYIETSAKTAEGVEEAFLKITEMLIQDEKKRKTKQNKKNKKLNQGKTQGTKVDEDGLDQSHKGKHCCAH